MEPLEPLDWVSEPPVFPLREDTAARGLSALLPWSESWDTHVQRASEHLCSSD